MICVEHIRPFANGFGKRKPFVGASGDRNLIRSRRAKNHHGTPSVVAQHNRTRFDRYMRIFKRTNIDYLSIELHLEIQMGTTLLNVPVAQINLESGAREDGRSARP